MSLNLNSLLTEYKLTYDQNFFWQKEKKIGGPLLPLPIRDKYLELTNLMMGLYIIEKEFQKEDIKELIIETSYTREFNSIKKILETLFYKLVSKRVNITINHKHSKKETMSQLSKTRGDFILFSGGLDSLSGALDLSKDAQPILIHVITNQQFYNKVIKASNLGVLKRSPLFCYDARTKSTKQGAYETRGIFFCSIAYAISASYGENSIVFCENGSQMLDVMLESMQYPNKPATRNTNIIFLNMYEKIFTSFSKTPFYIKKIYLDKTKSEIIKKYKNYIRFENTTSCFTTRGMSGMCGMCYNCFIRRVSLNALDVMEESSYVLNPFMYVKTKSKAYHERQRILIHLLRLYYNVLKMDPMTKNDILFSTRSYFLDPLDLATRFAKDIFLGVKKNLENCLNSDLNALGIKAKELLDNIDEKLLIDRDEYLNKGKIGDKLDKDFYINKTFDEYLS